MTMLTALKNDIPIYYHQYYREDVFVVESSLPG